MALQRGAVVSLEGLKATPELNGKYGIVTEYSDACGRHLVSLSPDADDDVETATTRQCAIRLRNLVVVCDPGRPPTPRLSMASEQAHILIAMLSQFHRTRPGTQQQQHLLGGESLLLVQTLQTCSDMADHLWIAHLVRVCLTPSPAAPSGGGGRTPSILLLQLCADECESFLARHDGAGATALAALISIRRSFAYTSPWCTSHLSTWRRYADSLCELTAHGAKASLLLALHPDAGASSWVAVLPLDVLQIIILGSSSHNQMYCSSSSSSGSGSSSSSSVIRSASTLHYDQSAEQEAAAVEAVSATGSPIVSADIHLGRMSAGSLRAMRRLASVHGDTSWKVPTPALHATLTAGLACDYMWRGSAPSPRCQSDPLQEAFQAPVVALMLDDGDGSDEEGQSMALDAILALRRCDFCDAGDNGVATKWAQAEAQPEVQSVLDGYAVLLFAQAVRVGAGVRAGTAASSVLSEFAQRLLPTLGPDAAMRLAMAATETPMRPGHQTVFPWACLGRKLRVLSDGGSAKMRVGVELSTRLIYSRDGDQVVLKPGMSVTAVGHETEDSQGNGRVLVIFAGEAGWCGEVGWMTSFSKPLASRGGLRKITLGAAPLSAHAAAEEAEVAIAGSGDFDLGGGGGGGGMPQCSSVSASALVAKVLAEAKAGVLSVKGTVTLLQKLHFLCTQQSRSAGACRQLEDRGPWRPVGADYAAVSIALDVDSWAWSHLGAAPKLEDDVLELELQMRNTAAQLMHCPVPANLFRMSQFTSFLLSAPMRSRRCGYSLFPNGASRVEGHLVNPDHPFRHLIHEIGGVPDGDDDDDESAGWQGPGRADEAVNAYVSMHMAFLLKLAIYHAAGRDLSQKAVDRILELSMCPVTRACCGATLADALWGSGGVEERGLVHRAMSESEGSTTSGLWPSSVLREMVFASRFSVVAVAALDNLQLNSLSLATQQFLCEGVSDSMWRQLLDPASSHGGATRARDTIICVLAAVGVARPTNSGDDHGMTAAGSHFYFGDSTADMTLDVTSRAQLLAALFTHSDTAFLCRILNEDLHCWAFADCMLRFHITDGASSAAGSGAAGPVLPELALPKLRRLLVEFLGEDDDEAFNSESYEMAYGLPSLVRPGKYGVLPSSMYGKATLCMRAAFLLANHPVAGRDSGGGAGPLLCFDVLDLILGHVGYSMVDTPDYWCFDASHFDVKDFGVNGSMWNGATTAEPRALQ